MIKINKKEDCCGCHACMNACPKNAIEMVEDEKGFRYPKIDKSKCINCGLCEKVCPILNVNSSNNKPKAYAAKNNDDKIRLNSSSGGLFYLLADYILSKKGVVYGASFDHNFDVEHIEVSTKKDLNRIMTSKYVQSNIKDTYKKAKNNLDEGRFVLFTGTPCQIEGLLLYLRKDYEKLYTQDIICHGVPSPQVWRKYISGKKIQEVNFRNKDNGWVNYNYLINAKDNNYCNNHKYDNYSKSFLSNYILRDSCYKCKFKKYNRLSDITLGDLWGANNIIPEMDDDKGTSLLIIHSKKGEELFDKIKSNCSYKKIDLDQAVEYNSAYITSVSKPKNMEEFYNDLSLNSGDLKVINKYVKVSFSRKIKNKIKSIIKRVVGRGN